MPSFFSAFFRPLYASALKLLSFRPPMSVTSATLRPDVACAFDGLAEPTEATVSASAAQSASDATTVHLRIATFPPWWCI